MWHFIKWLVALVFVAAVAFLSLANGQFVEVNYLLGMIELPLSLVIFVALSAGIVVCALWMLPRYYCLKWAKSNQTTDDHA